MPYITSVEKIGYERGVEEGGAEMQARILSKKFGVKTENLMGLIQALGPEGRAELADAFWDLDSPEALMEWIKQRVGDKKEF